MRETRDRKESRKNARVSAHAVTCMIDMLVVGGHRHLWLHAELGLRLFAYRMSGPIVLKRRGARMDRHPTVASPGRGVGGAAAADASAHAQR
jgi:hypothetical protein